jgi:hypothetical protein
MTTKNKNWETVLVDLENKLAEFFTKKLPVLSTNIKGFIVKYIPHFTIITVVLEMLTLGIAIVATPFVFLSGIKVGLVQIISVLFGVVAIVLEIKAVKGLFKREMKAWKLLFYVSLISATLNLLRLDIFGLIIGSGISWYVLFQIRSYYK